MNVYDFDGTIYRGDSSLDFYIYSLIRRPWIVFFLPWQIFFIGAYKIRLCCKERAKSAFFVFIKWVPDMPNHLEKFWDSYEKKIEKWYLHQQREDDVIISASPEFLLNVVCRRLKINSLIASKVNINTGNFEGKNCYGAEKVRRYREIFKNKSINAFYTDSLSDIPMMKISKQVYLVNKAVLSVYNI